MTPGCAPAAGPSEGCPTCGQPSAGSPISLASGNTYIEENDIRIPGLSGGLSLDRKWNSLWPATQTAYQIGLFGPNWRSTFEERVFVGADHYMKYGRSDGSFWSFGYSGGVYQVAAPANITATLVQATNSWTLTFQNGGQRLFDGTTGKLTAIVDRNENTTQLSYDSLGRLITVTDPVSRHLYFNYGSGTYLVTSITSDFGVTVSYFYDGQGRLSQVTEPDGSTLSYQYNSSSLISAVLDSQGKTLESHTYDSSGRGLTSSRANGVDAVTITYQ
jgi:YD repeat-containing protein